MSQFLEAIDSAIQVLDSFTEQGEVDQAVLDLTLAMEEFRTAENPELSVLQSLVDEAYALLNSAEEGEEEGMYEVGSKASFLQMILLADEVVEDELSTQDLVDEAVLQLIEAISSFKSDVIPPQPLYVFSDVPGYGDIQNYFLNSESIWEVVREDGEVVVGMQSFSTDLGQYMLIRDSTFSDFDLQFEARVVDGVNPNDIMIVLGYQDDNHYSYIKLSELLNKTGVFTKDGTGNSFNWLLIDYKTLGVSNHAWASYRVLSTDSVITVYREDQELFMLEAQAGVQYSGSVGIGTYYMNRAYFDNIELTRLGSISGLSNKDVPGLRCYPNPVEKILTLEPLGKLRSITLFDSTGKVMMEQSFQTAPGQLSLNLDNLPEGIYFLRHIQENGSIGHERIVKN
jgi:hypothetical protein